ncbi:hypothetical protein CYLTODRAFT_419750 [Cylindrobasidium torrendii FP15055 ss-10]|uniref:Uncharacterized protein n=1 Tax=Cylindrobasidium torrendii FP15055 ss-10 TaxID=1314674 RepID=A0A0D7BJU8_9AGAR|nr:hypothetical protein CYLTODRAFT_419750 [Cylindrobasidium torrendii FP15055 ss-10]
MYRERGPTIDVTDATPSSVTRLSGGGEVHLNSRHAYIPLSLTTTTTTIILSTTMSSSSISNDSKTTRNKLTRTDVSPPLSKTRLSTLIYILVFLTTILSAFYGYRIMQWRSPSIIPTSPSSTATNSNSKTGSGSNGGDIESRISALAEALGVPSKDLARAIAGAVRENVPPASISAVKASNTKGSDVLEELFREPEGTATGTVAAQATGVVESVMGGVENFVGMDEP